MFFNESFLYTPYYSGIKSIIVDYSKSLYHSDPINRSGVIQYQTSTHPSIFISNVSKVANFLPLSFFYVLNINLRPLLRTETLNRKYYKGRHVIKSSLGEQNMVGLINTSKNILFKNDTFTQPCLNYILNFTGYKDFVFITNNKKNIFKFITLGSEPVSISILLSRQNITGQDIIKIVEKSNDILFRIYLIQTAILLVLS